jgi:hypothetical protein
MNSFCGWNQTSTPTITPMTSPPDATRRPVLRRLPVRLIVLFLLASPSASPRSARVDLRLA